MTAPNDSEFNPKMEDVAASSLENRVAALERAVASLGDHTSPGHRASLEPYIKWRESVERENIA